MRGPALVIVVVLLSIVTSIGTVLGIERLRSLTPAVHAAPPKVGVPSLKGLSEEDARQNLKALGLIFLVGDRSSTTRRWRGNRSRRARP
jgi:beta-lactam-binding protein with PASTA domain